MEINISKGNSKLKKDGIWSFGLPAGSTCPKADVCKVGCYALSGRYIMDQTLRVRNANFVASLRPDFVQAMTDAIGKSNKKPRYFRIHDSGDFYNREYLFKWMDIVCNFPDITFYAYTKSVQLFFESYLWPKNFVVVFSYGGKEDHSICEGDKHLVVFPDKKMLLRNGYKDCSKSDLGLFGEEHKLGIVYHGVRKWENTAWPFILEELGIK